MRFRKRLSMVGTLFVGAFLQACTNVSVDQMRWEETNIDPNVDTVVVLGRHHSPEYETEPSLISCLAGKLRTRIRGLQVLEAEQFRDQMYPWFEPRTAPLNMNNLQKILDQPRVFEELKRQNLRYMIWIEGSTETVHEMGSMSCAIGPGGGGCFGFGSWEDESAYEASIWDFQNSREAGRISADAQGTSYVPAVVVPVPMLARVQSNACDGLGKQLSTFLQPTEEK